MSNPRTDRADRPASPNTAAFVLGLPLAALVLGLVLYGPLRQSPAYRYIMHPVEWAEVTLFCCALGALLGKLWQTLGEARVCRLDVVPRWDGVPVPVSEAPGLLAKLDQLSRRLQSTYLARRMREVLHFLCQRRSASDLDDHLRFLAETDAINQENSYGLIRFICWAVPILGFLGTVLGITGAIGGVTPEVLEQSLSQVTDGLGEAFDATALALGLTMITMFLTYLVERREQGVLALVDRVVERELAHRFQREALAEGPFADVVRQHTEALVQSVEGLVSRQASLWAEAMREPQQRAEHQFAAVLRQALEATLQTHAQRLAESERQTAEGCTQLLQQLAGVAGAVRETGQQQQAALVRVAEGVASQAGVLGRLQEDATNLVHLQAVLHQNLSALAGASAFEQAVHTLTAAVHLLTARVAGTPANLHGPHPGPAGTAQGPHAVAAGVGRRPAP